MTTTTTEPLNTSNTIEEVERYAELIDKYGILIVIAAIFLLMVVAIMALTLRSYLKSQSIIQEQNQTMFNTILNSIAKDKDKEEIKKEEHKELVGVFMRMSIPIRSSLEMLAEKVGADRTSVYVFHNGTNSSHGLPFIKISCLAEVMKRGTLISRKITLHQGLPLSTFDKSIIYLVTNQTGYILDNDTDERFPSIKNMLGTAGAKSAGFLALYDDDNNMLGIIITEFGEVMEEERMKSIIETMKEESLKVIPVLDYADYQEKKITE